MTHICLMEHIYIKEIEKILIFFHVNNVSKIGIVNVKDLYMKIHLNLDIKFEMKNGKIYI